MICTLTMNPALDLAFTSPKLQARCKLRCTRPQVTPGGGGINCSRAIARLGGDSTAVFCSGGEARGSMEHHLKSLGIGVERVDIAGDTRLNLLVNPEGEAGEYRFILPGPVLSEKEWQSALQRLEKVLCEDALLVASGSLPPGVPVDFYARVAALAERSGAHLFLDGPPAALGEILGQQKVFALKPNAREWSRIRTCENNPRTLVEEAETAVRKERWAEILLLSLGSHGAVCVTRDSSHHIASPPVNLVDTTGAGDSMFGAFVLGIERGKTPVEAARYGVAAGAATTEEYGSELCRAERVNRMLARIGPVGG